MPGVAREMKSPAEIKAEQLRQQRGSASPLLLQDTGLKADREGIPSRDRVSAAIALVRARQAARTLSPTQSPRSTKGSTIGNSSGIVASGNKGNQSPMRKPLSSTKGNSPDIEAHRSNQSPLRMPLSQKTQDSCAPMHSMEAPRLSQPNASVTLSPRAKPSFFTNIFASRALSLPALVRTADENNNQENAPEHHRHEEETPVTSRSDVVKSSRATPSSAVARNSAPRPPISPGDIAVPLVNSNDSDDFSLDPQTLTDVARFIDAVHNKHKLKVPANPTPKKQPILQPASSESTDYDDYSPVSPETLAGIGHYIDAMAKPKEKSILVSATSSSDGDDTIPVETKVGIGAFIDALHNKSIVQEETKQTLYVSSSEDSSTAHAEQSEIEKYYQCRSLDEDDGLQLLSAVLSDGLEMEEHDGEGEEQTIDDAMNLSLAISPNPSDLAGEGFLGVEPASPVDEIGAPLQDPAMLLSAVLSDKVEMEELDGEGEEQTIDDAVNLSLAISPNPSNLAEEGFLGVEPASPDDEIEAPLQDPASCIDADDTTLSEREDEIEDPGRSIDADETTLSEREIEDPVSIIDAEETAMSECEDEIKDSGSSTDAEETAMSECEDEIEDSGSSTDAEETAMSEREDEIEDSGSSTDADETAMSQCEDEIEFPGSSTDAAETAMSEREDEIEDPGSSIDADETAMSEREDDIEDPVSIIDDDETAMSEREDDIEDPVSIVDAEETAMSEREEEIEDPGRSIDAGETVTSERDPATNSDISTTDSSCGEDPGPAPSEWNHQNDRVDEKIENEVIAGTESIEMPIVVNSEDVLDDAALVGETGATLTDEEESCNIQEQNIDACELIAAFKEDLSVGSSESTQGEESPLSPQSQGPLLRVFSDMESFDEDDNITAYLSRMGANGDDAFFSKLTPPEGATEEEIAKLNAVAGGVSKECVDTTFDEHDMDHDAGELVNAFLSGETTTESSKDLVRHQQSEGVPKKVDEAVTLIAIESHEDKPSSLDSIEPYRSKECVDQDNTTDDFKSEMVIESADAQATNDVSFDDVAGELINAFLRGAEDAPLSPESEGQMKNEFSSVKSGVVEKESTDDLILSVRSSVVDEETIDDLIEDLVATIGESDSAVFVKLALGASNDKLKKLKSFIRAVAPYLTGQSAPLVAEAEIRGVAIRVGITEDEVEKVIEQMSFFGENLPSISEVSSADLANIFNDEKFDHMEEIDETENISAFLSRMTALEAGGHFGETEANDIVTEEAVEIDLDHGFVNRKLETVLSDEAPWWNEEDEKAEEDPTPTTASLLVQTIFSEDEEEQESHTEEKSESIMTKKSQSTSLRKSGTPRSRSTRSRTADVERTLAEKKQKAQSTSQQRPEMVRSFVLQTQMSAELPHSISLTRVPSMLSDLETMFEEREQRMSRSNKAKQGEWKSPWDKRWVSSGAERMPTKSRVTPTVSRYAKAPRIGGVAAAMKLSTWSSRPDHGRRMIPVKQHWRLAYKERTKNHPGYSNVDVYSIYEASVVVAYKHPYDEELWENRDVKQRFLHEKSISLSRNWFGALLRKRGNDRYREPVAEPKSMEMPMEHRLGEGEWVEEWYTTWQQRQNEMKKRIERGTDRSYVSDSEESDGSETYTYGDETTRKDDDTATYGESVYTSRRSEYSRSSRHRYEDDDDDSWEEPPECGTFQNVKQKIGERLSLVHHQHLSSLRESRWRKKYFPRGTFPYK